MGVPPIQHRVVCGPAVRDGDPHPRRIVTRAYQDTDADIRAVTRAYLPSI